MLLLLFILARLKLLLSHYVALVNNEKVLLVPMTAGNKLRFDIVISIFYSNVIRLQ